MNWIMYLTWLAGPLLQITLLIFMVRRNYHTVFPRFFSYILFQTVKSACLFVAYRYFVDSYFDAYWTGNALSLIFTVVVMDEILRNLFHEYGAAQVLSTTIFRWSCVLLLLLAILGAMSSGNGAADTLAAVVLSFDRSMRVMQVGLFLLLMILCRLLTNSWRQQGFGIALGFGVFASVELILVSIVIMHGELGTTISLMKSTAYNLVTLIWIGYLSQQPQSIPGVEELPATRLGLTLATPDGAEDPDASFMLRVEHAVDRVLSRSDWPRPSTRGSRIVGRKPYPEEGN